MCPHTHTHTYTRPREILRFDWSAVRVISSLASHHHGIRSVLLWWADLGGLCGVPARRLTSPRTERVMGENTDTHTHEGWPSTSLVSCTGSPAGPTEPVWPPCNTGAVETSRYRTLCSNWAGRYRLISNCDWGHYLCNCLHSKTPR